MSSSLKTRLQKTFTKPFWINWLQATVYGLAGMAFFTFFELIIIALSNGPFGGSLAAAMIYVSLGVLAGLWVLQKRFDKRWIYGALGVIAMIAIIYLGLPAGTEDLANILLILIPLGAVLGPMIWKK